MSLKFGTDGVRGVANAAVTPHYVMNLGRAAAQVLGVSRVVIGRDTRRSGPMLEAALAAGFAAEGVTVDLLGVLPTPGVAHVARVEGVAAAVITASHNAFADNGIKLFAPGGHKLPDDVEARIEAAMAALTDPRRVGNEVGTIVTRNDAGQLYAEHLTAMLAGANSRPFDGLRLVLDCAHGAMTGVAADVVRGLGAAVVVVGDQPNGSNINDGVGATHAATLARTTVEHRADLGLAFDGDGDRLIAVDHRGNVVDGDHLIALLAADLRAQGRLAHDTVVVTVMSNLGFHKAMVAAGITVATTAVGDRYVLEALGDGGFSLGGEQSGHIIIPEFATTGDGLLAGLLLIDFVKRSGRPLADLAAEAMRSYPQVLINTRVGRPWAEIADEVQPEIAAVECELGGEGRVLVRPSGTEPLVRVMVEAATDELARSCAERIIDAIVRAGA